MGLDRSFGTRRPHELSGGQRQRVGVARALSADPPVMLMDEPFGAIDPITRERLQNEFLRVQEDIRKTIVFVTHDIDEAIKMGDRIAILRQGSRIAQYDRPEVILSEPADDFVSDFIGSGASLKRLNLARVRDYELAEWPTGRLSAARETLMASLRASDKDALLLLDDAGRPRRWVRAADLRRSDVRLDALGVQIRQGREVGCASYQQILARRPRLVAATMMSPLAIDGSSTRATIAGSGDGPMPVATGPASGRGAGIPPGATQPASVSASARTPRHMDIRAKKSSVESRLPSITSSCVRTRASGRFRSTSRTASRMAAAIAAGSRSEP